MKLRWFSQLVLEIVPFLLSTKECSKVEIVLFLVPALSYQAYAEHPSQTCNCRQPYACPLAGNCLTSSVVYRATVHVSNSDPADDMC